MEQRSQLDGEKRDFMQRIADREEALHQANVSTRQCSQCVRMTSTSQHCQHIVSCGSEDLVSYRI